MIKLKEYSARRKNLMSQMGESTIAIIPSAHEKVRSKDTNFRFRQDSHLSYLCGFPEPESALVLIPGREQGEVVLFCRDRDREREIWDGYRFGPKGAIESFEVDDAFPISDMDEILPGLLEGREKVFYSMGKDTDLDRHLLNWINEIRSQSRTGASPPGEIVDMDHLIDEMRLFKSPAEVKLMKRAGAISAEAHNKAMRLCQPGLYEYQLQAEIESEFAMQGAAAPAYNSIVGAGANACVLHYVENRDQMQDGDLVLIDAGCEYEGYAADITRTFPVNGQFSEPQRQLYEICLESQIAAIEAAKPGNRFIDPHEVTVEVITRGLIDLGLLKGSVEELIESGAYRDFYMHKAGHWLGMDVHDVGEYKVDGAQSEWREFEPGMVITVEPGIYVHPENKSVAAKWRGIGIRIEDDVLITSKGNQVLTSAVPKTVSEVEALMAG